MRLLLDTHTVLWWLADDDRLGKVATELLSDSHNSPLLSAAVIWEVAIKRSFGKLSTPEGFVQVVLDSGAQALPIAVEHAAAVERLPWHHRDPFDRLLVAQASIENAVIVTRDEEFSAYGVPVAW